ERAMPRAASADAVMPTLLAQALTVPPAPPPPPPPPPTTTTSAPSWADPVTEEERVEWSRVNMCEENGNWHVRGSAYSGGLGISEANWVRYGGQRDFGPEWAATPDEQIVVAMRIQPYPPDQHGCTGGW
ncbi:MAG TPA: transglycosylase family protein, partial [Acidimicrobiales bacterium]|nr:transglycosylase family protein [Acidimicrobiales bacterium]